jgi:protein-L-isoaspartate(D-aspartate) O-methyltransferase
MDSGFESHAYQDKAFPIAAEQTISQPYTVAFQSQLLQVQQGQSVLEIGTGSGYQTAVLTLLGADVYSIERQHQLYRYSMRQLPKLGYRPKKLVFGDGYKGLPEFAPFDRILVTAGATEIPKALLNQLAIGGRMVIPVGAGTQEMILMVRISAKEFEKQKHGTFRFVPMLTDKN